MTAQAGGNEKKCRVLKTLTFSTRWWSRRSTALRVRNFSN
nr:MAG TPA: hypothetical protein [Caudoviricetes sp.]